MTSPNSHATLFPTNASELLHIPAVPIHDAGKLASSESRRPMIRLRRNRYVDESAWQAADARTRKALHALAAHIESEAIVLSHTSAAALLGIPVICARRTALVESVTERNARSHGADLRAHRSDMPPDVRRYVYADDARPLTVTTPAQTAIDLARHHPLPTGLAALDHVLHHQLASRDELEERWAVIPRRALGRARSRLALSLADGAAESPGESLSRARMYELHLPRPQLQFPVTDGNGELIGRADFLLVPGVLGEFDGRSKYFDPMNSAKGDAAEALWMEKQREDRLRRRGYAVARWIWADAYEPARLLRILGQFGIRPTRDSWF